MNILITQDAVQFIERIGKVRARFGLGLALILTLTLTVALARQGRA